MHSFKSKSAPVIRVGNRQGLPSLLKNMSENIFREKVLLGIISTLKNRSSRSNAHQYIVGT